MQVSYRNWVLGAIAFVFLAGCATATPAPTPATARRPVQPTQTLIPTAVLAIRTPIPSSVPTLFVPAATPLPPATIAPVPTNAPVTSSPTPRPQPAAPQATPIPAATPTKVPPTAPPAPAVDFVVAELRVLGLAENNGGIEGAGALRNIYITVLDAAGQPINGATLVNTAGFPGKAITGDKGPGKAEILMDREVFQLKVESVNGAAVSSATTHPMSLIAPVPADIAGKLGSACPTVDNCPLPPYKHYSYVLTFKRTH
jgi:hypothetical protein